MPHEPITKKMRGTSNSGVQSVVPKQLMPPRTKPPKTRGELLTQANQERAIGIKRTIEILKRLGVPTTLEKALVLNNSTGKIERVPYIGSINFGVTLVSASVKLDVVTQEMKSLAKVAATKGTNLNLVVSDRTTHVSTKVVEFIEKTGGKIYVTRYDTMDIKEARFKKGHSGRLINNLKLAHEIVPKKTGGKRSASKRTDGAARAKFMRQQLSIIIRNPSHRLRSILTEPVYDNNGKPRILKGGPNKGYVKLKWKVASTLDTGRPTAGRYAGSNSGWVVQAGDLHTYAAKGTVSYALQLANSNMTASTFEAQNNVFTRAAIKIDGSLVELTTAQELAKSGTVRGLTLDEVNKAQRIYPPEHFSSKESSPAKAQDRKSKVSRRDAKSLARAKRKKEKGPARTERKERKRKKREAKKLRTGSNNGQGSKKGSASTRSSGLKLRPPKGATGKARGKQNQDRLKTMKWRIRANMVRGTVKFSGRLVFSFVKGFFVGLVVDYAEKWVFGDPNKKQFKKSMKIITAQAAKELKSLLETPKILDRLKQYQHEQFWYKVELHLLWAIRYGGIGGGGGKVLTGVQLMKTSIVGSPGEKRQHCSEFSKIDQSLYDVPPGTRLLADEVQVCVSYEPLFEEYSPVERLIINGNTLQEGFSSHILTKYQRENEKGRAKIIHDYLLVAYEKGSYELYEKAWMDFSHELCMSGDTDFFNEGELEGCAMRKFLIEEDKRRAREEVIIPDRFKLTVSEDSLVGDKQAILKYLETLK